MFSASLSQLQINEFEPKSSTNLPGNLCGFQLIVPQNLPILFLKSGLQTLLISCVVRPVLWTSFFFFLPTIPVIFCSMHAPPECRIFTPYATGLKSYNAESKVVFTDEVAPKYN